MEGLFSTGPTPSSFHSYYEEKKNLGLDFRGHPILPFTMEKLKKYKVPVLCSITSQYKLLFNPHIEERQTKQSVF